MYRLHRNLPGYLHGQLHGQLRRDLHGRVSGLQRHLYGQLQRMHGVQRMQRVRHQLLL